MSFLRTLTALSACLALSSGAPTGDVNPCQPHKRFRLMANVTQTYLAPVTCTMPSDQCNAYFNENSTTGFEYIIAQGANHLMIAAVPPGSSVVTGLYADILVDNQEPRAITFTSGIPAHMNCTVVQSPSGDGTCDLKCMESTYNRRPVLLATSVETFENNLWYAGKRFTETVVKAVYPST